MAALLLLHGACNGSRAGCELEWTPRRDGGVHRPSFPVLGTIPIDWNFGRRRHDGSVAHRPNQTD